MSTFKFRLINYDDLMKYSNGIKAKGDCEYLNKSVFNDALEVVGSTFLKKVGKRQYYVQPRRLSIQQNVKSLGLLTCYQPMRK